MTSRRNFLQKAGLATAASSLLLNAKTSMSFIHHVLFWAKNPTNEAEKAQLLATMEETVAELERENNEKLIDLEIEIDDLKSKI